MGHFPVLVIALCTLILSFIFSCNTHELASNDESRLLQYLFEHKKYNPLVRPIRKLNDTVKLNFNLALIQIIQLDEKNQVMKTNVWLRMGWTDYQLTWNKEDYGGIQTIRIHPSKIWTPELVLFNNADGNYQFSWSPNVLISNDGSIVWIPPALYVSSCTIDVRYFPFDEQECEMRFGSWTYDATQVSLEWLEGINYVDLKDYWPSGTWDLIKFPGQIVRKNHSKTVEYVYKISLRRKILFFTVNLIIPCILITLLTVSVFYLPADCGEKITLCISVLLALVVFLLLISKILPPTSISIPLISKYLLFTFVMNIITIFVTVLIINWNFRTPYTHKMPRWVRVVFMMYLPKILLMTPPQHVIEERKTKKRRREMEAEHIRHHDHEYSKVDRLSGVPSMISRTTVDASLQVDTLAENEPDTTYTSNGNPPSEEEYTPEDLWSGDDLIGRHHHLCQHAPENSAYLRVPDRETSRTPLFDASDTSGPSHESPWQKQTYKQHHNGPIPVKFRGVEITPSMRTAIAAINYISCNIKEDDDFEQIKTDWKYVASVFDRLFLYLFGSISVLGTLGIILNSPYLFSEPVDQNLESLVNMYSPLQSLK